jgi:hypothetical protein
MRELFSFLFWVAVFGVICTTFAVMGCDDLPMSDEEIQAIADDVREMEWQNEVDRWVESQRK